MHSYAQVPVPIDLGDFIRIYFTTRFFPNSDLLPVSNIGYIDVDRNNPKVIFKISENPVLNLGALGSFDQFGQMPADIVKVDRETYLMYYTGWTRMADVPYKTSIGIAKSTNNCKTFKKMFEGPILSENPNDPILVNGPSIIKKGDKYYMFYSSASKWIDVNGKKEVFYYIKQAVSKNGINWVTNRDYCIKTIIPNEVQNAPRISKIGNLYYLWFCYRDAINFRTVKHAGYRLALAVSRDLVSWERIDEAKIGISYSHSGWDSEMMCYPYLFKNENKSWLFYNGNYFGETGFGYAELEI